MIAEQADNIPIGTPSLEGNRIAALICIGALVAGSYFCLDGALRIDADGLGDLGIVDVMVWQSWAGLGFLVAGFSLSLVGTLHRTALPWFFLMALVAALHLVPAYSYDNLRYSWAWKHVGIVDYLVRHHALDRSAPYLSVYHNWPGFFVVSAWIAEYFSASPLDIAKIVAYAPPVLEALYLIVLHALLSKISQDRRLIFLAQFVFLTANWIGQDYFSPQGTVYLLYLLALLLCLGPLQRSSQGFGVSGGGITAKLSAFFSRGQPQVEVQPSKITAVAATVAILAIIVAIVASHQLTPLVLAFALAGLALIRRASFGFALFAFMFNAAWILYVAAPFVDLEIADQLASFGDVFVNATIKFVDLRQISPGQAMVSLVSRTITVSVLLLAVIGMLRRFLNGKVDGPLLVMLAAPLPVFIATSYGGEAIFRVYLFMLPSLAFLAAGVIYPSESKGRSLLAPLAVTVGGVLLVGGFLLSNNGKDMQYRFRHTEVDAAYWLYSHAPKGSLLVEGARNYPSQFLNYENFSYVPIADEAIGSRREIVKNPVVTFARWLDDKKWKASFIILTRSQKIYLESQGLMPQGSVDRLIASLSASPRFRIVYRNADAIVFSLNEWAPENSESPQ